MKKLFYFAFMAMLCCGFTACGNDDGGVGDTNLLYGRWTCVQEVEVEEGEWYVENLTPGEFILNFDKDGTGYLVESEYGYDYTEIFRYKLLGNLLTLYYTGETQGESWKVTKLTNSELVLLSEGQDEYGYWKEEWTFVRY